MKSGCYPGESLSFDFTRFWRNLIFLQVIKNKNFLSFEVYIELGNLRFFLVQILLILLYHLLNYNRTNIVVLKDIGILDVFIVFSLKFYCLIHHFIISILILLQCFIPNNFFSFNQTILKSERIKSYYSSHVLKSFNLFPMRPVLVNLVQLVVVIVVIHLSERERIFLP